MNFHAVFMRPGANGEGVWMKNGAAWLLPLIPLTLGVIAIVRGRYGFAMTVTLLLSCLAITVFLLLWSRAARRGDWLLPAAYLCCLGGDAFLFHRGENQWLFIGGIALFGLMHGNYFLLLLGNGRIHKLFGAVFTALLLVYFGFFLLPLPGMGMGLKIAALVYLLLSCLTLAAAVGLRLARPEKLCFITAIGLMIFSDTTISFKDFLHWEPLNFLLMPTYYFSLILMTTAMSLKLRRAVGPRGGPDPKPRIPVISSFFRKRAGMS